MEIKYSDMTQKEKAIEILKREREKRTLREIGDQLDVSESCICRWIKNGRISRIWARSIVEEFKDA